MRICCAFIVALLPASPAAAQSDNSLVPPGAPPQPAAQTGKFRKPAIRAAVLHARAAARRAHLAPSAAAPVGEGTPRVAAAAAPAPPSREPSLSQADRLAIQFDLAWTGDYNGLANGEANDKTSAAIKAFQRNRKFKETGVLNTQERALLAALAKARQAQVGWTMVDDPATGARLGVPTKHVP